MFDKNTLTLHSENKLAEIFGTAGIDMASNVIFYDSYDGQSAALLSWLLEHLGHTKVSVLSEYLESWARTGGKLLYRPVTNEPRNFNWKPGSLSRANIKAVIEKKDGKLLDVRGRDEFLGKMPNEPRTGHIPGAINLPWTELLGPDNRFLRSPSDLEDLFSKNGLKASDQIITYCSNGPRAALGYIALQFAGRENVRVYDGSFHEWALGKDLPIEAGDERARPKSKTSVESPCIVDSIPGLTRSE